MTKLGEPQVQKYRSEEARLLKNANFLSVITRDLSVECLIMPLFLTLTSGSNDLNAFANTHSREATMFPLTCYQPHLPSRLPLPSLSVPRLLSYRLFSLQNNTASYHNLLVAPYPDPIVAAVSGPQLPCPSPRYPNIGADSHRQRVGGGAARAIDKPGGGRPPGRPPSNNGAPRRDEHIKRAKCQHDKPMPLIRADWQLGVGDSGGGG